MTRSETDALAATKATNVMADSDESVAAKKAQVTLDDEKKRAGNHGNDEKEPSITTSNASADAEKTSVRDTACSKLDVKDSVQPQLEAQTAETATMTMVENVPASGRLEQHPEATTTSGDTTKELESPTDSEISKSVDGVTAAVTPASEPANLNVIDNAQLNVPVSSLKADCGDDANCTQADTTTSSTTDTSSIGGNQKHHDHASDDEKALPEKRRHDIDETPTTSDEKRLKNE